ncbi:MAG: hypothetical protein KDC46_12760 [Thermoleophilia bacterium]|nr:hypothetical protein [Thermoleophilia bacterium]
MMLRRSISALAVSSFAALVACAPSASATVASGPEFGPTATWQRLHAVVRDSRGDFQVVDWAGANRSRVSERYSIDPRPEWYTFDALPARIVSGGGVPRRVMGGSVERRPHLASPDGGQLVDRYVMDWAWPLVARQRAGENVLSEVVLNGRRVLRGTTTLAANDCGGLAAGTRTVFLHPATLVPIRVIERRTGERTVVRTVTARRGFAKDFTRLRMHGGFEVRDTGFMRRGALAVATHVNFPVVLPSSLPAGYRLTGIGDAPRGAMLGPEASFPSSAGVYEARWSRGLQHIDLTVRPARATLASDWDESDPFGAECEVADKQTVTVGLYTGHYVVGEQGNPRLWWRQGNTLLTIAGPYGPDELATIGASLQAIDD